MGCHGDSCNGMSQLLQICSAACPCYESEYGWTRHGGPAIQMLNFNVTADYFHSLRYLQVEMIQNSAKVYLVTIHLPK